MGRKGGHTALKRDLGGREHGPSLPVPASAFVTAVKVIPHLAIWTRRTTRLKQAGFLSFQMLLEQLDNRFMKKYLQREPTTWEDEVMKTFEQITNQ